MSIEERVCEAGWLERVDHCFPEECGELKPDTQRTKAKQQALGRADKSNACRRKGGEEQKSIFRTSAKPSSTLLLLGREQLTSQQAWRSSLR